MDNNVNVLNVTEMHISFFIFPHAWNLSFPTRDQTHISCTGCSRADSVRPHRWQPTRLPSPWNSPGKKTGVGCHFLLQCMKEKSESEVAQSCLTFRTPWTAAYQAPPTVGFSRQEYWSGLPLPSPNVTLQFSSVQFSHSVMSDSL